MHTDVEHGEEQGETVVTENNLVEGRGGQRINCLLRRSLPRPRRGSGEPVTRHYPPLRAARRAGDQSGAGARRLALLRRGGVRGFPLPESRPEVF